MNILYARFSTKLGKLDIGWGDFSDLEGFHNFVFRFGLQLSYP